MATSLPAPHLGRAVVAPVVMLALALAGTAGCGGGGGEPAAPTGAGGEASPATQSTGDGEAGGDREAVADGGAGAEEGPEEAALRTYRDGQDVLSEVLAEALPDPTAPQLEELFTGAALRDTLTIVADTRRAGEYAETTVTLRPEVVVATSTEVVLDDCVTERWARFDAGTGDETGSGTEVTHLEVRVTFDGEAWMTEEISALEEPCTP